MKAANIMPAVDSSWRHSHMAAGWAGLTTLLTVLLFTSTSLSFQRQGLPLAVATFLLSMWCAWRAWSAEPAYVEFYLDPLTGKKRAAGTTLSAPDPDAVTRIYTREDAIRPWVQQLLSINKSAMGVVALWAVWQVAKLHISIVPQPIIVTAIVNASIGFVLFFAFGLPLMEFLGTTRPKPSFKADAQRALAYVAELEARGDLPLVDLFIPCCKEPLDVVQDTVLACLHQDYPAKSYIVHVLDDGGDDSIRNWVQDLASDQYAGRVTYIRRKKVPGVPHHYKAGNMNHALGLTSAPIVAQLDADMIPTPRFLRCLLAGLLSDAKAAYAYCPQTFYNWGLMDLMGDHQLGNYTSLESHAGRASVGLAPNGGSGVMWRRKALNVIGGWRTESLGEDYLTSFDLMAKGYTSVYCRELLQTGLAPWTPEGWLAQHHRWTICALEQFGLLWRDIIASAHLSFVQKYILISGMAHGIVGCLQTLFTIALYLGALVVSYTTAGTSSVKWLLSLDCQAFRVVMYVSAASYVLSLLATMVKSIDLPSPYTWVSLVANYEVAVEKPFAFWWTLKWLMGRDGGWKATGSVEGSKCLLLVSLNLASWAVGAAVGVALLRMQLHCSHPFWWWTTMLMLCCTVVGLIDVLMPAFYYKFLMPHQSERKHMIPRDKLTGVPTVSPATVFPKVHTGLLAACSLSTVLRLAVQLTLCALSLMYPPEFEGRYFCTPSSVALH